ncbi:MAG: response regulator [Eubacterium sp.]|nr:response regulator [Eubacterium sp.]
MDMHKIFIVDDEMWIIIGLKKLIEKSGMPFVVVGEANNGVMALEAITRKKPDILFADIRMPGYNGLELMKQLKEKDIPIKVVFISGYPDFEYTQSAIRLGAFDYLLKPVEQDKLNEVLERLLEKDRGREEELEKPVNLSMMQKILQEVKQNYAENITLTEMSKKYGISVSHLSGLLKEELQMSFSEYIATKRIQKAKELLTDEQLSVETIAGQVGYSDYFYFIKVFKKYTGISPSKYRKNLLKS